MLGDFIVGFGGLACSAGGWWMCAVGRPTQKLPYNTFPINGMGLLALTGNGMGFAYTHRRILSTTTITIGRVLASQITGVRAPMCSQCPSRPPQAKERGKSVQNSPITPPAGHSDIVAKCQTAFRQIRQVVTKHLRGLNARLPR
jgi:hypothetical protein